MNNLSKKGSVPGGKIWQGQGIRLAAGALLVLFSGCASVSTQPEPETIAKMDSPKVQERMEAAVETEPILIMNPKPASPKKNRASGEYLVKLKKGGGEEDLKRVFKEFGVKEIHKMTLENWYRVRVKTNPGLEKVRGKTSGNPEILHVQTNRVYYTR